MSTIALGTFTAPQGGGGKTANYDPKSNVGRPFLAIPRSYDAEFKSTQFPEPKPVLIYDVVDLKSGNILTPVVTGSGKIVDHLRRYVPGGSENPSDEATALPVKIETYITQNQRTGYKVVGLEGAELKLAQLWYAKFGMAAIDAKRAEVAAEAAAEDATPGTPAWAQDAAPLTSLTPAVTAPVSGGASGLGDADLEAAIKALG